MAQTAALASGRSSLATNCCKIPNCCPVTHFPEPRDSRLTVITVPPLTSPRYCLQDVGGRFMYPNLKLKLWSMGIRQNQLAKTLGIDETMLSKLINGFREPSPEMRAKIANALNADESWLFERVQSARTRT